MADVVIDATGSNKSMGRALEFGSFAGRIVYVGITQQDLSFPHAPIMHRRELTHLASRNALPATLPASFAHRGRRDRYAALDHPSRELR